MTDTGKVVAIANQKGGVAKTTTAINLGASLALAGRNVLLIDLDPQSNLTSGLGLKGQAGPAGTVYEALTSDAVSSPAQFVLPSAVDRLFVMPANRHLTGAEIELVTIDDRERRLSRLLTDLRHTYDHILIDSPPSLGLLTLNALVAADAVLIPLNCEYFALEGIAELLSTIDGVRAALNPALAIDGVVLTMYDDRTNLGQQVSANIREYFGDRVYQTVIPRNIRLGEAPSHGLPVILYDARSRGADAYVALAHEFLARRQPTAAVKSVEEDAAASTPDENAPRPAKPTVVESGEKTVASEPAAATAASPDVMQTRVNEPEQANPAESRDDGAPELEERIRDG